MTSIVGIAYCSHPVDFSFEKVEKILKVSRRNNEDAGLTGALVYDNKNFVQWLEGEPVEVRAVFERISRDPRHTGVQLLTVRKLSDRWFPTWSMSAAVTQDQTLRGLKLVPHLSLANFNPSEWSDVDAMSFMDALSDYLIQRPTPTSETMSEPEETQRDGIDPIIRLDRHLSRIA